jgi:hypothetical protein
LGRDETLRRTEKNRMRSSDNGPGARIAWTIAFVIVAVAVGGTIVFRGHLSDLVGQVPWFLRTYAAIIGPCEVAAAILLTYRAVRLRTQRAALLAAAYVFSAPLVLENLFTLPGILGPHGALAHQTPPWCWAAFHVGWAAFIVVFAWFPDRPVRAPLTIIGAALAVSLIFGFLAAQDGWLPPVLAAPRDSVSPLLFNLGWTTIGLLVLAAFGLGAFRDSTIDAWLLIAVFALALDEMLVLTTTVRFSAGTYLARTLGAINAVTVLLAIAFEHSLASARSGGEPSRSRRSQAARP